MFLVWLQEKNKSDILTKDISSKCKCRFDGKESNDRSMMESQMSIWV